MRSPSPPHSTLCSSTPFSLCPSSRKSSPPPPTPFHLLLSPLLYECWGVGRGRPWAGHPVRGLLRVPGLSAGAYRREIHINTCLLCLPPLDTAGLPAWHRLHRVGLLSGLFNVALSANLLSVLLLHRRTRADNAEFEKAHFHVLLVPLMASTLSPWITSGLQWLQHAASSHTLRQKRGLKR